MLSQEREITFSAAGRLTVQSFGFKFLFFPNIPYLHCMIKSPKPWPCTLTSPKFANSTLRTSCPVPSSNCMIYSKTAPSSLKSSTRPARFIVLKYPKFIFNLHNIFELKYYFYFYVCRLFTRFNYKIFLFNKVSLYQLIV